MQIKWRDANGKNLKNCVKLQAVEILEKLNAHLPMQLVVAIGMEMGANQKLEFLAAISVRTFVKIHINSLICLVLGVNRNKSA